MEFLLQLLAELFISPEEVQENINQGSMDAGVEMESVQPLEGTELQNIFGMMHFH